MDVAYTEGDRVIELNAPEEIYDIAALLRDNERSCGGIYSRNTGDISASVSTTRLHNIAGKYTGRMIGDARKGSRAFQQPVKSWLPSISATMWRDL